MLWGPLGVLKKHFDQFWEFHFEALEANGGQNAPETSGEVGLSWKWSRKIPGEILTYLDTKKVKIRPFKPEFELLQIILKSGKFKNESKLILKVQLIP